MYSVLLEYTGVTLTKALADFLMDDLESLHVGVGSSPTGRLSVRMTFPAETVEQAFRVGTAIVEKAVARWNADLTPSLEVAEILTEAEFDRREGWAHIPDLIGVPEAADILGVSRQRVLQLVESGRFASVQRIGERTSVLSRAEVESMREPKIESVDTDRRVDESNEDYIVRITRDIV